MSKKNLFIIIASITTILVAIITTFILINNKNDTPIKYKVTFNSNGGTAIKEQIVNAGEKATKPYDPTKEGYLFVEWQYNNITFNFATQIDKDINLIAKWQEVEEEKEMITVRFETDGGTTISNQIIESGTKITKPEAPLKEGYIFKGWYYNDEEFNFDASITEDIEIKARWEEEPKKETEKEEKPTEKKYTVTFNSNGGSEVKKQEVKKGSKATKPSNPIKDSYIFINWTLDGKEYNFDTKITKNITLVANWGLLGDVNNDNEINAEDTVFLKRYLADWDVKISTINSDVNLDGEIDDIDLAIITRYRMNEVDRLPYNSGTKYSITYNLNGGTFEKNEYVPKKYAEVTTPIQYAEFSITKEGYVFIGWTGSNGNTPRLSIEIPEGTKGNLEYNANWLLYGDVNNDSSIDVSDLISISQYLDGIKTFTENQKLVADVNNDRVVDDVDVHILAKYISDGGTKPDGYNIKLPYISGQKYTIKYNLNGGITSSRNPQTYAQVSLPLELDNPEKEGYVFIGWTGSNGNTPQLEVTIEEGTTGNLEYNANWLLYGDVTNDNKVDIGDSILIQQYIEGTSELTKSQKLVADVNLDSKVDDIDVKIIRDYLANKIDKLPYTS